jgi:hypothetical protein
LIAVILKTIVTRQVDVPTFLLTFPTVHRKRRAARKGVKMHESDRSLNAGLLNAVPI